MPSAEELARDFTAACVSDGAGSCALSRIGSELACREVCRDLKVNFDLARMDLATASAEKLSVRLADMMSGAVQRLCLDLRELANKSGASPKDFSCTFLLVVHCKTPSASAMLGTQVGDGFIAGLGRDGRTHRFGKADSGQYSGQVTCFIPDDASVEKAAHVFTIPHEELEALMLCTDGIEDPFFPVEKCAGAIFEQLYRGVGEPLPDFSKQHRHGPILGPKVDEAALEKWLKFEKRGENDDRTLLVLHRHPRQMSDPLAGNSGPAAG